MTQQHTNHEDHAAHTSDPVARHQGAQGAAPGDSQKRISPIELQKHLKGTAYPASKDDLVKRAQDNKASEAILDQIRRLPLNTFESPKDVMKAFGQS